MDLMDIIVISIVILFFVFEFFVFGYLMNTSYIFYTNKIIPDKFHAYTVGPVVLIRPEHKDNVGLLEHEKIHVGQFWRNPFLFGLRYLFSENYRFASEVEAFKEQLKYSPDKIETYAKLLVKNYNLSITEAQAVVALKNV